ncbi:MAG: AsmA-like C-terminal region-containing protein, partial [Hyphomicrobium sp.]
GVVAGSPSSDAGEPQWQFKVQAIEGVLSAEEFGAPPVPIESLEAAGRIIPGEGLVQLAQFSLKAGGGEVTANGEVITGGGTPSTRVEAQLSPMPIMTLKAMWPRAAAPAARAWVGTQVERGSIKSASLKILSGRFLQSDGADGQAPQAAHDRVSASIEVSDLRMHPLPKSLPMEAPQATLRLENSTLELTVPQAAIIASDKSQLPLRDVRFTVVDVMQEAPMAELAIKSQASLSALIDTLNHSQLHLAGEGPLPVEGVEGKVDGEIKIAMPLVSGGSVVKAEGKARITELKGKSKVHKIDLQGGTVDISVSDVGVIAKGDMILNGVPAKLQMQRILDAPPEMQPPIRLLTTLDNSDRTQLGLDVNHLVQGSVPVEVSVTQKAVGPAAIHVRADLTNAELMFVDLAWRKSPGRIASLEFDVDAADPTRIGLTNFRLVGDTIAVDGTLTVDEKREVRSFSFPNFSLNVVSRLAVEGTMGDNRIWKIKATGATFDAKDVFRQLLVLGNTSDSEIKPLHPANGVDLTAEIGTVLGHGDLSLRKYTAKISERGDKLVSIDAAGTLDGGAPLTIVLKDGGSRVVHAQSADAGQAFRLIGFYPNMQGGNVRLEVDLEAKGNAEKSGVLWVEDFRVLGDTIVSDIYSGGEASPEGGKQKKVQREVFEFQRMRAPFEVGHGQFVLDDSYVRGPLLGASIRGTVDYNTRRLNLGGTYVPLQGINAALCEIPVIGPVVTGFDCQGVFGLTYSIEGPMASPQVYVNPLSMFTPGILRAIMEMTNPNPQVRPVKEDRSQPEPARASSTSVSDGSGIDGWSSETTPASKKQGAKKP